MITTHRLRERLRAGETLTFIFPAIYTDNSRDLKVVVQPTDLLPYRVFVEGIQQYDIPPDSELYRMWFKKTKELNPWEALCRSEWRYLLELNGIGCAETNDPDSELLYHIQDKVYQFYLRGKYRKDLKGKKRNLRNKIGKVADWSKGPYNKENKHQSSHRRIISDVGNFTVTRSYKDHTGKQVTRTHSFRQVTYETIPHEIEMKATQRPVEEFRYVMDVVTKAVERVPIDVAKDLIERFEHYDYCTRRDYRIFMRNQEPEKYNKPKVDKPLYWKDKPEEVKNEEGIVIDVLNFMPKVNPKDKINQDEQMVLDAKNKTRRERRDWKHKKRLYDRNAVRQLITIEPKYEKIVYKENEHREEFTYRKNKTTGELITKPNKRRNKFTKVIDISKSKLPEPDKFQIKQIVFDYEYGPRFRKGQQMFDTNGEPLMKKYYVGKRDELVTIEESPRTIYKTIVTKQYPGDLSKKRGIIKRNIELLRKYQAEQKKTEEAVKSE